MYIELMGPAGSGKTTLLRELIVRVPGLHTWDSIRIRAVLALLRNRPGISGVTQLGLHTPWVRSLLARRHLNSKAMSSHANLDAVFASITARVLANTLNNPWLPAERKLHYMLRELKNMTRANLLRRSPLTVARLHDEGLLQACLMSGTRIDALTRAHVPDAVISLKCSPEHLQDRLRRRAPGNQHNPAHRHLNEAQLLELSREHCRHQEDLEDQLRKLDVTVINYDGTSASLQAVCSVLSVKKHRPSMA